MSETSKAFREHVKELERLALAGDEFATRSLCAIALVVEGWRPDDPDGGEELPDNVISLMERLAA